MEAHEQLWETQSLGFMDVCVVAPVHGGSGVQACTSWGSPVPRPGHAWPHWRWRGKAVAIISGCEGKHFMAVAPPDPDSSSSWCLYPQRSQESWADRAAEVPESSSPPVRVTDS